MYLYYDAGGSLKEIINDIPLRQGSSNWNKIYIYWEGIERNKSFVRLMSQFVLPNNDRFPVSAEIQATEVISEIPYNNSRDLYFFEYYREYTFFRIDVPDEVLASAGSILLSPRIIEGLNFIISLEAIPFFVEATALGSIAPNEYLNIAQYNELLKILAGKLDAYTKSVIVDVLPESGIPNTLYFVKGTLTGEPYKVYIWYRFNNDPNYPGSWKLLGEVSGDFASKQEEREFEQDLLAQFNAYKQQVDNKVNNALDMTPIPVATVNDLPPQGATQPYVVAENGYWYYWNGTQWVQGQQYQAVTGYKTLPVGTLNKAYVNEIIDNVGSLCYIEIEGVGEDIVNELTGDLPFGGGYAWHDVESDKVMFWFYNGLYEIQITGTTYTLSNTLKATRVYFDNSNSGLEADNVQDAIDELKDNIIEDNFVWEGENLSAESTTGWKTQIIATGIPAEPNKEYSFVVGDIIFNGSTTDYGAAIIRPVDANGDLIPGSALEINHDKQNTKNVFTTPTGTKTFRIDVSCYSTDGGSTVSKIAVYKGNASERKKTLNPEIKLVDNSITENKTTFIENNLIGEVKNYTLNGTTDNEALWKDNLFIIDVKAGELYSVYYYIRKISANIDATGAGIGFNFYNNSTYINYGVLVNNTLLIPSGVNKLHISLVVRNANSTYKEAVFEYIKIYKSTNNDYVLDKQISTSIDYRDYANAYNLPVLYIEGDVGGMTKDDEVSLNYKYKDLSGACTMKWQGSSSLNYAKKNYTIKFDNKFEAKEGWGEQKKYCLKANYIDFSHCRNVVSAKLWAKVRKTRNNLPQKLIDSPNYGAVDGFPICLIINGEYKGIYTFNIPKDKWTFNMGDGLLEAAISCEGGAGGAFDELPVLGTNFEVEYATDEDNVGWIQTALTNIYNAFQNATRENFVETVGQYIDIDSLVDYINFIEAIHGVDNTAKNFLLITYDGVKWYMSAYDMDSSFGLYWDGKSFVSADARAWEETYFNGYNLYYKSMRYLKDAIKTRWEELTGGVISPAKVAVEMLNFAKDIPQPLHNEDLKIWKSSPSAGVSNVNQIVNHYKLHKEDIDKWWSEQ